MWVLPVRIVELDHIFDGQEWTKKDSSLLTPASKTNENSESARTCIEQNPDPIIINKTHRQIRSGKPPQQYSPGNNYLYLSFNYNFILIVYKKY